MKILYSRVHEDVLKNLNKCIFEVEKEMPFENEVRHKLYLMRTDLRKIIMENRENKDQEQNKWVFNSRGRNEFNIW